MPADSPDVYECSGRVEVSQLNEEFHLDIRENEEEYHTLAGYILTNNEALPMPDETFVIGRLRFTVLKMTSTKIELLKVERLPDEE